MITVYIKVTCYESKPLELIACDQISLTTFNLPLVSEVFQRWSWIELLIAASFCVQGIPICTPACSQRDYEMLQLLFQGQSELNLCETPSPCHSRVVVYSNDLECQRPKPILFKGNRFLLFRSPLHFFPHSNREENCFMPVFFHGS